MDDERLARRIRLGEDSTLELKRVLLAGSKVRDPERNDFADELAAMANRKGGTFVLGVADKSREVLGIPLERIDDVEGWVREICNDSIKPPLDADINKIELPDSEGRLLPVIQVVVPRTLGPDAGIRANRRQRASLGDLGGESAARCRVTAPVTIPGRYRQWLVKTPPLALAGDSRQGEIRPPIRPTGYHREWTIWIASPLSRKRGAASRAFVGSGSRCTMSLSTWRPG